MGSEMCIRDSLAAANNPSGDADARLSFTLDARATSQAVDAAGQISAEARINQVTFSCDTEFTGQNEAALVVQDE